MPELLDDPRFADHAGRVANGAALRDILQAIFDQRLASELEVELAEAQVPASMVRTCRRPWRTRISRHAAPSSKPSCPGWRNRSEWSDPASNSAHDGPDGTGPVPSLGEHTDAVLREIGMSDAEIAALHAVGAA